LAFGILAALVKVTAFAGFLVVGFLYTCALAWRRRKRLAETVPTLLLAGSTVLLAAVALTIWIKFADGFMAANPLASLLRSENLSAWYLGVWSDRWGQPLWDWTVRLRALPQALGVAWFVALYALARMGLGNRLFLIALMLLAGYLSEFVLFPKLHMNHFYYQVENAILLCAAAAVCIEGLLERRRFAEAYVVLGVLAAGQLWSFYSDLYFKIITDDLHNHPYYKTGAALKDATPPDSVIVVFGTGYGADITYFADRRGIVLANWFPVPIVRQVLFDERERWFGGRRLGAVVDCAVYVNQAIDPNLVPIRDELKQELGGKTIEVTGSFYGATVNPPKCDISVPRD
jgi:hypothetical protein